MSRFSMIVIFTLVSLFFQGCSFFNDAHPDYVSDERTAVGIAEVVFEKNFGKDVLLQRPFKVRLDGGYWVVDGSAPKTGPNEGYVGGVAHIEIRRHDGEIRNVSHGK